MKKCLLVISILIALVVISAPASAALQSQLGVLDLTTTNPATGAAWADGDNYHLTYITTATRDALSTDIADYNTFVTTDATDQKMGGVNWFVMGSTATVNAIDNAVIQGPVMNVFDSGAVATDAADLWNLDFTTSTNPTTIDGGGKNVHFGTAGGGTAQGGLELGGSGGSVRIEWTGWSDWAAAWRGESTADLKNLVAISEPLTVTSGIPEPAMLSLLVLGGVSALVRRERRK